MMNRPKEAKPIPGHDGYYASVDGTIWGPKGRKYEDTNGGYKRCKLGNTRWLRVHTLVLITFVGPQPEGQQARHLNGKSDDNRLINLKWGTPKENQADRKLHGTWLRGERHGYAKLTEQQVREIWSLPRARYRDVAERYHVHTGTIQAIWTRRSWQHLELPCAPEKPMSNYQWHSRLKSEDILVIRAAQGLQSAQVLAKHYGVSTGHIDNIWHRRVWKHL